MEKKKFERKNFDYAYIYSIIEENGIKNFSIEREFYDNDSDGYIESTFYHKCSVPLNEFIDGYLKNGMMWIYDMTADATHYCEIDEDGENTEALVESINSSIENGEMNILGLSKINADTPCGKYISY